jgi:ribokinase
MSKIVVVGSLNMDVVAVAPRIPVAGETIIGNKYFTEPGGKGANQAYAAAKLGGKVVMLGRIGDDDFGRRMRDNVASTGCDVGGLRSVPGASGVALIFVSSSGQNSIVVVPGANGTLTAANIEAEAAALDGARIVLLQLENPVEAVLAAARLSRQRGARVILDPAPAPAEPLPAELLATVDIVTPNETEAAILAGLPPGRLNLDQASALAAKLQAMGAPTVIMKLGEQGCLLVEPHKSTYIPAPKVTAVDTTAAGDTYNAALAVGLSEGMELVDACRFAVYASALSVTRLGTQLAVPARGEVDEFRTSVENRAGAHQA